MDKKGWRIAVNNDGAPYINMGNSHPEHSTIATPAQVLTYAGNTPFPQTYHLPCVDALGNLTNKEITSMKALLQHAILNTLRTPELCQSLKNNSHDTLSDTSTPQFNHFATTCAYAGVSTVSLEQVVLSIPVESLSAPSATTSNRIYEEAITRIKGNSQNLSRSEAPNHTIDVVSTTQSRSQQQNLHM